jgi:GNAT superfamily N-acetyltransferase
MMARPMPLSTAHRRVTVPHDIAIRRAALAESDAIASLLRRVMKACLPYLPDLHTPEEDRAFVRDRMFARCAVWVAAGPARTGTGDAVLHGFCAFREDWVEQLYVEPALHRIGLGARLLAPAKAAHPRLQLWVFQRNLPAIAFYEAQGFRLVRLTDGHDNEEREPDALYVWER